MNEMLLAWGPHTGHGPPGFVFPLVWLVVLAAVVTTVVLLRRRAERRSGPRAGQALLAEMYARGEVDADEYRRRRGVLGEK